MPTTLAAAFTPAEVTVLRLVADEHRDHGGCARSVDEIAARAAVCRRTVQNALRHAECLGLVSITERRHKGTRNLSNVGWIRSREEPVAKFVSGVRNGWIGSAFRLGCPRMAGVIRNPVDWFRSSAGRPQDP